MSKVLTTKSPIFWLIVAAGVILPAITLTDTTRAAVTSAVVLLVVLSFGRARRRSVRSSRR